jgi:predicted esterase
MTRHLIGLATLLLACCSGGSSSEGDLDLAPAPLEVGASDAAFRDGPRPGDAGPHREPAISVDRSSTPLDGKPGEFTLTMAGRSYRLLVPSGYSSSKPIALLVGFHGSGDTGSNFYAICKAVGFAVAAAPASFILLVPDTKSPLQDFANWSGNPNNDVPKMKQEMDEIVAIIKDVSLHYRVDGKHVHAFGFSDGGLFCAVAGMYRSDFFASLSICGFGWGGSYPLVTPARKIATQLVCGQQDSFYSMAQQSESFLKSSGHPTQLVAVPGVGHQFSGLMQADPPSTLFGWTEQYPLP